MSTDFREELHALADTQTFTPDPSAWDRGRRARRHTRIVRGAAAVVAVAAIAGASALALQPDREARTADTEVPGGAIPSVIPEPGGDVLTDLAVGRASVAYVDSDAQPVLVDASTGEAHRVELPDFPDADSFDDYADSRSGSWFALSPDGTRLAYPTVSRMERDPGEFSIMTSWYRTVDLATGESELVDLPACGPTPWAMTWTPDDQISIVGINRDAFEPEDPGVVSCTVDPSTGDTSSQPLVGVMAPGAGISATFPGTDLRLVDLQKGGPPVDEPVDAVPFVTSSGSDLGRGIPDDHYPDGSVVRPIGWADDSLLVAEVGDDVVLLTSPDRSESEWVWRTLVEDLPEGLGTSIAVDLVPDLDGSPEQQLTHDFSSPGAAGAETSSPALPVWSEALLAVLALVIIAVVVGALRLLSRGIRRRT
ncbi:hypothetical protein [Nocardioides hwasunensis]|uniref:WD40 repeat domain-containing protein n=1 Tax=Nocardioides hwasunensis TaxID=397258 RepID=A0ABR8MHS5_9ACTN|nr:hypothetical protein [Nocardioides hwasunensis]MBD3915483.1 hypothetical protein [Nocardioides hwasunensis]